MMSMAHVHNCSDCGTSIPEPSGSRLTADACWMCDFLAANDISHEAVACRSCAAKRKASWRRFEPELREMEKILEEEVERLGSGLPIQ